MHSDNAEFIPISLEERVARKLEEEEVFQINFKQSLKMVNVRNCNPTVYQRLVGLY